MTTEAASSSGDHVHLSVVDWDGPIVEVRFLRPISTTADVERILARSTAFLRAEVLPRAPKAWFLTCYDHLVVAPAQLSRLRERFVAFNRKYSHGDVRYGGDQFARTLIVATSLQSGGRSNHFVTRDQALSALRGKIHAAR